MDSKTIVRSILAWLRELVVLPIFAMGVLSTVVTFVSVLFIIHARTLSGVEELSSLTICLLFVATIGGFFAPLVGFMMGAMSLLEPIKQVQGSWAVNGRGWLFLAALPLLANYAMGTALVEHDLHTAMLLGGAIVGITMVIAILARLGLRTESVIRSEP